MLRPRVRNTLDLARDLSLHNDVRFSLLVIFVRELEGLPMFRSFLIHEREALERVIEALSRFETIERFPRIVACLLADEKR
jgi:hypothetical protein